MKGSNSQTSVSPIVPRNTKEGTEQQTVFSRCQIIKNLFVICMGFTMLFTAYSGLSMLQSTMNQKEGIGVVSQAIIYAGFCISALLLPKYTISKLGCKYALVVSMICYIPYIAANVYFNWLTMVPSAILVGLAASILWSSNCTYFSKSAERYSIISLRAKESGIHDKQEQFNANISYTNCSVGMKDKMDISIPEEQERSLQFEILDCEKLRSLDIKLDMKNKHVTLESDRITNGVKVTDLTEDSCIGESQNEANKYQIKTRDSKGSDIPYVETQELKIQKKEFQITPNSHDDFSNMVSSVAARFFGFAGLMYRSSDIWSNLMSYYILQDNSILDNITESSNCSCGASFCNVESNCFEHNLAEPSPQMRNILTGISVILAVLAIVLVYLFLDELEDDKEPVMFSFSLAMATCKFVSKKEALLLFPLSAYIGLQQGFYIGDFTKSYIACAWGVYHVGLVSISYGIASGIASTVAGILVKYVGRVPVMIGGAVINAGVNIYLLIWNPLPDQPTSFFLSAACWGLAVGILWSQLRASYGVIFKNEMEAAFAGFYFWDSIGYFLSFSYSNYICTYIKIYILLAVSTIGIIGYVRTESIFSQRTNLCETKG